MAAVKPTGATPATTTTGTTLDPDYEQRLAAEAEAGYDPATLTRRRAGRPSLSGRAGHSHRLDLRVDDETYHAIQHIAHQHNRKISDVVRDAIHQYLQANHTPRTSTGTYGQ
jgi:Ribbon-helix-helix protein, copG family